MDMITYIKNEDKISLYETFINDIINLPQEVPAEAIKRMALIVKEAVEKHLE